MPEAFRALIDVVAVSMSFERLFMSAPLSVAAKATEVAARATVKSLVKENILDRKWSENLGSLRNVGCFRRK